MTQELKNAINKALAYLGSKFDAQDKKIEELTKAVKESKQHIELDLTTRAIEKLQDSKAIDANQIVDELKQATNAEIASKKFLADKLAEFEAALDRNINGLANLSDQKTILQAIQKGIAEHTRMMKESKGDAQTQKLLTQLVQKIDKLHIEIPETDLSGMHDLQATMNAVLNEMRSQSTTKMEGMLQRIAEAVSAKQEIKIPDTMKLDDMQFRALAAGKGGGATFGGGYIRGGEHYTTVRDGSKNVTTAGTAVQLSSTSVLCEKVEVTAKIGNTDVIVVGASTVVAATGTRRGTPLDPGQTFTMYIDDLSKVYIDSVVSGEGCTFTHFS